MFTTPLPLPLRLRLRLLLLLASVGQLNGFFSSAWSTTPSRRATAAAMSTTASPPMTEEEKYDVIVVGAGVGGLASAARLANEGMKVLVCEANDESVAGGAGGAGGRCGSMLLKPQVAGYHPDVRFRFDTGPSLLLLPDVYEEAFALAGGEDVFRGLADDIHRVKGPIYTIYFDGDRKGESKAAEGPDPPLILRGGEAGFEADCLAMERLEPGAGEAYARHMVQAQRVLDGGLPNFIENRLRLPALVQMLREALFGGAFPLEPQEWQLRRRFKSPKARAALSFQSLYVGLTPFAAPGVFSLLQPLELGPCPDPMRAEGQPRKQGVFYPMGGFGKVSEALLDLARARGATVRFGARVKGIEVVREGEKEGAPAVVAGVRVQCTAANNDADDDGGGGGEQKETIVAAKRVLVNADLPLAEELLLGRGASSKTAQEVVPPPRDFSNADFSSSVVAFHFALNVKLEGLSHHSLFLAVDEPSEKSDGEPRREKAWDWEGMMAGSREKAGAVNFYVHAPSRTDPEVCPAGHDAITVLVPCPTTESISEDSAAAGDDDELVSHCRKLVLERFNEVLTEPNGFRFEDRIVAEDAVSPRMWRRQYGLGKGAVFGLAHPILQLSFFRPGPRHPDVKGLYFCGASSRPGNGVPLVLIGARQTTEVIMRDVAAS
jgi:phytoene desaturase